MLENFSIKNWQNGISGLGIEISSDCNLRCKYCYYYRCSRQSNKNEVLQDTMFYANIGKNLNKIFTEFKNIKSLDFWGAEPLLHIDRIKFVVEHIIDSKRFDNFNFLISSNMAHSEEIYDKLFEMFDYLDNKLKDVDMTIDFNLQTSIDFPKKIHNKHRVTIDGKPTYSKVKHNYINLLKRLAKKNYKKIRFSSFTKSTYNYAEISLKEIQTLPDDIFTETLKDLPTLIKTKTTYEDFHFNMDYFATPATGIPYTIEDGVKNYAYYKKIFENFDKLYLDGKLTYGNAMFFLPGSLRIFISDLLCLPNLERNEYPVCRSGISFIGLKINGDIYPCHHFFTVENRDQFRIGNIHEEKYDENLIQTVLNTYYLLAETFEDFQKKIFDTKYAPYLKYGSLQIVSDVFYRMLIRHFCFAENCETKGNWSDLDLDSLLKLYPVQWLDQTLAFISKYREVFVAVSDKQFLATYDFGG